MEFIDHLTLGFSTALTAQNLLYCFFGTLLGTLVGVLPGVGPTATIAVLLPITFTLPATTAIIMLAGIYYGAQYGGSTSAILINLPGEASSAISAIDGHMLARHGRAGAALATAALGSFFAGTVSTLLVALFAPPLTTIALRFGAAEYFSLVVLALIGSVAIAHGSMLKALAMIVLGLLFGLVGQDIYTGMPRFTLGQEALDSGIEFIAIAGGVFAIAEVLRNLENPEKRHIVTKKVDRLYLTGAEFRKIIAPVLRGTGLGALLGVLPGSGHILASFAAYSMEKRVSKHPEEFGRGAIEGLAAPESANNAAAQTSFIPLLTLGIPAHPVMALILGAFILQGITPGPKVIQEQPALIWGLIASMWVGNLMLVILNLPLVGIWVRLLTIPYDLLFPAVVVFCLVGTYTVNNNPMDIYVLLFFGAVGYLTARLRCEPAPLLLGFILGPILEENFRRAMIFSHGDLSTFVTQPISAGLLVCAVIVLGLTAAPYVRKTRKVAFQDG